MGMPLWDRFRRIVISQSLTLKKGALLLIEQTQTGAPTEIDLSELAALNNLAAELAASVEGLTATAAEINQAADVSARAESVTAATKVMTSADNGKTMFLNKIDGITVTLPAPALGFRCRFVVGTAPTSVGYIIVSAGGTDIIALSINELETDTGDDGPYDDNADTVTFVDNLAAIGDFINVECDGTLYYLTGQTNLDGGVTSATT